MRNNSGLKFSNHNHTEGKSNYQIFQVLMECYNHIFYNFDIHEILGSSWCYYAYLKQKVNGKDTVHVLIFFSIFEQKARIFSWFHVKYFVVHTGLSKVFLISENWTKTTILFDGLDCFPKKFQVKWVFEARIRI